ncbi:MAG: response regulator [Oligoflexia bacterium]|nr:response regulator [Oligoflexia bacterium]
MSSAVFNSGLSVLVVEDDASVRETLGMVLEAYHYRPVLVESGQKALEYLAFQWPDVMLLDLTLKEMSGEQVYRQIEGRFGRVPPTVVLSAVQHGEVRASHLHGAWFLAKPYTIEELVDVIQQASRSRAA